MSNSDSKIPGLPGAAAGRVKPSARARLRTYFLTGLIVAGPLAITLYITWWFINLVDGWMKPLVPARYSPDTYLPFAIPGFGLVIAFVGLTLLGFLTANLVGKSLLNLGEVFLARMPVVRSIYKGVKQIFETVFKQDGQSFRQVGLIEWPGEGLWSLVLHHRARGRSARRGAAALGAPLRLRALHAEPDHRLPRHHGARARQGGRPDARRRLQAPDVDGHHPAREPRPPAGGGAAGGCAANRGETEGGCVGIWATLPNPHPEVRPRPLGRGSLEGRNPAGAAPDRRCVLRGSPSARTSA